MAANLAANRLRLLLGADEIPDPLERVVEFLNAQVPHIEVLAVEIKQLRGESVQAVAPRVSGRTAAGSDGTGSRRRRKLTREELLEELPSEEARMVGGRTPRCGRWIRRGFGMGLKNRQSRCEVFGSCTPVDSCPVIAYFRTGMGWRKRPLCRYGLLGAAPT